MKSKIVPSVLTALAVSFLFALGLAGMSNYSAATQESESETTVSMAKGSQAPDNPEFYVPAEVTVKAGETITWKNEDTAIHTATSGENSTPDGKFDTSLVSPGQSSKPQAMPSEAGEYSYFCTLHPWMTGTVTVS
jgi:plastocyanin